MTTRIRDLVLGGGGLIGSELVHQLRRAGHETFSLDLKSGCDLRCVDRSSFDRCDRIWFLAWDTGGAKYIGDPKQQHKMYRANSELCARVFDHLEQIEKPFLFVTSQLAGQPNAYGLTKLIGEHWARQLGGKIARLWNTYGWERPDIRSHVITDLVLSGLLSGRVRCRTTGKERRRFIYKADSVSALVRLFDGPWESGDIAGPKWMAIREVAAEVARQLETEVEVGTEEGTEWMVDPQHMIPGWEPSVSLNEGISMVIKEARAHLSQDRASVR